MGGAQGSTAPGDATATSAAGREAPHPGMVWIPDGTFSMGSDAHYPEEAPTRKVSVMGSGWISTP